MKRVRHSHRIKGVNQRLAAAFAVPPHTFGEPVEVDPDYEIKAYEGRCKEQGIIEPRRRSDAVSA